MNETQSDKRVKKAEFPCGARRCTEECEAGYPDARLRRRVFEALKQARIPVRMEGNLLFWPVCLNDLATAIAASCGDRLAGKVMRYLLADRAEQVRETNCWAAVGGYMERMMPEGEGRG